MQREYISCLGGTFEEKINPNVLITSKFLIEAKTGDEEEA